MNRIFKRTKWLYILGIAFLATLLAVFITFVINAKTWVVQPYNNYLFNEGKMIGLGTITDRNGDMLVQTKNGNRVYSDDVGVRKSTLHVVGDAEGFISTGAQTAFRSRLTGYNLVNGLYGNDQNENYNLQLTIDAQLSKTALNALGSYHGTIGVYNYQTGEILCAVSTPTYDVENKPKIDPDDSSWEGVYINRFLSGSFTPGSTFKIITSASALENVDDIMRQSFNCPGHYDVPGGGRVKCAGTHGTVSFQRALNQSCNSAFARIAATEISAEELQNTAEEFGFNKTIKVNGIPCEPSFIDLEDTYAIDRAWAGIGQYTTLVNPCHECTLLGAIANKNGRTPEPTLIKSIIPSNKLSYCSSELAAKLDNLLRSNVEDYYGDGKFPNLQMCGKTGTAEVADKKPHTWFVGYSQREDLPLCIVVVLQNSGSFGVTLAVPTANQVMQKTLQLYTN